VRSGLGVFVDVSLQVDGDDSGEGLAELHEWLRQEPELRGHVTPVAAEPKPGELGTITDLLSVAVGGGGALTVLTASLKSFFAQPRRSDVRITIRTADGRSMEIDAKRVKDVEALLAGTFDQSG
jgi:hypothetical protein